MKHFFSAKRLTSSLALALAASIAAGGSALAAENIQVSAAQGGQSGGGGRQQETAAFSVTETINSKDVNKGEADFSDYDVNFDFYVTDGVLNKISLTSGWGTAPTKNRDIYSDSAMSGVVDQLKSGAETLDAVSGATCTSKAAMRAISAAKEAGAFQSVSSDLSYTMANDSSSTENYVKPVLIGYDKEFDGYQYKFELDSSNPASETETGSISMLLSTDVAAGGKAMLNPSSESNNSKLFKYEDGVYTVSTQLGNFEFFFNSSEYGRIHLNVYNMPALILNSQRFDIGTTADAIREANVATVPNGEKNPLNGLDADSVTYRYYTSYDKDSGTLSGELQDVPTKAGVYYCQAETPIDSSVYFTDTEKSNIVVITIKNEATISLEDAVATYTGEPIAMDSAVVSSGTTGTVTYKYYSDQNCRTEVDPAEVKLPGTYYVKATVSEDDNYTAATSNAAMLTINKATPSVTLADTSKTYTGKAIASKAAVVTGGTTGTVTYTYYSDAACTKEVSSAKVKMPGTYYVKASVSEDDNYNAASSNTAKLTIKQASQKITGVTSSKTVKYTKLKKASQKVSLSAKATAGKISFKKVSGSSKITVSSSGRVTVKKGLKKGTYTIKVKVSAKATSAYKAASTTAKVKIRVK